MKRFCWLVLGMMLSDCLGCSAGDVSSDQDPIKTPFTDLDSSSNPSNVDVFNKIPSTEDWPQFLGPNRDGVYRGKAIRSDWKSEVPKTLWKVDVGDGFAGPVVGKGRVYLFHRMDGQERVDCLNAENGDLIWSSGYAAEYRDDFGFDPGPRAVPSLSLEKGRIVTLGANGDLQCLNLKDGKPIWRIPTRKDFGADKGFFGMVCAPLIVGDQVVVNIGGSNENGILAFELETGKKVWSATSDEAGYSSPILGKRTGKDFILSWNREALVVLTASEGEVLDRFPFRSRMSASVNAATPLLVDENHIFLTASYGTGANLLKWGANQKVTSVWSSDDVLSAHYATPVQFGDRLFGYHGRQEYGPELRCIEWQTGKPIWKRNRFGAGSVMRWGEEILALDERGTLWALDANAEAFTVNDRTQVLGSETRAMPALSNGIIYARDLKSLVAVRL